MRNRIILVLAAILTISGASIFTSCDDKPIPMEQLPAVTKTYIEENYPDSKILIAKKDYEWFSTIYEVKLDNGLELTFDSDGAITDVDD